VTARPSEQGPAPTQALAEFVTAEASRPLAFTDKSAGTTLLGRSSASLADSPVALSALSMPMLTVEGATVQHNIDIMQAWCNKHGVLFAPHGKTVMTPRIWLDQLDAGAWGITVANEAQLRVAVGTGVPRIHLANTLVSPSGLRWLAEELTAHPELVVHFWVDSLDGIARIESAVASNPSAVFTVLVEVGTPDGRTGTRTLDEAIAVAEAVASSRHLELVGVAGYEGAVHAPTDEQIAAIDGYLAAMVSVHERVGQHYADGDVFLSAGGSSYFDRVIHVLGAAASASERTTMVVVRSGAYVTHDDGVYVKNTPSVRGDGPQFVASLHAWAAVISAPEPGLVILNAGRRDLPFDQGLPTPQQLRRRLDDDALGEPFDLVGTITQLNDQHAYLKYEGSPDVKPGDIVRLGISHPCTAFDKWRTIPIIDSADNTDPLAHGYLTTYF